VAGALDGVRIVEMAGIGPAPFAAMMLADHGAEVIRVERAGQEPPIPTDRDILRRSRTATVRLDLKNAGDMAYVKELASAADGLVEGFRPGVMERLGLGPDVLIGANPRLVYGRMTGWGQEGPLAQAAGHDINYLALSGALHTYGRAGGKPTAPVNAVADFGGGGMMLAFGMLAAILSAGRTGRGQVIDCAMVDGAALLSSLTWSLRAAGWWSDERGTNLLDSGAPYYDSYETADGRFVAIGVLEPQFYSLLMDKLGLPHGLPDDELRERLTALFLTRGRDEWCALLEGTDACFAPVLSMAEAPDHPHNRARGTFTEAGGVTQPAPAPRFSATPAVPPSMPSGD
jgi:alpha-methylacyl-CoA racemase